MSSVRIKNAFASALFVCIFLGNTNVSAVDSEKPKQKITISPATLDVSVAPGGVYAGSVTAVNQGAESFLLAFEVTPYGVKGLEYQPFFEQLPGTTRVDSWVHVDATNGEVLDPSRTRDVRFRVSPPSGTKPGGYYAVLFGSAGPRESAKQGISLRTRAGVVLYITVEGEVERGGDAASAAPVKPFTFGGKQDISSVVTNSGGVHFMATVSTAVYDMFGRKVEEHEQKKYVLPGTSRRFDETWQPTGVLGMYRVERSAVIFGEKKDVAAASVFYIHPLLLAGFGFFVATLTVVRFVKKRPVKG